MSQTEIKSQKPTLALRDEFHKLVVRQLLGPYDGAEEELPGQVRYRYLVGRLAPRRATDSKERVTIESVTEPTQYGDAEAGQDSEDGQVEAPITSSDSLMPSSIGLSFAVTNAVTQIKVTAKWGYYRPDKSDTEVTPTGRPKSVWKRRPVEASHLFSLQEGDLPSWQPEPEEQGAVEVRGRCRRRDGSWSVTLFLINNQVEPMEKKDLAWIFQPSLTVTEPEFEPIFVQRPTHENISKLQREDAAMRMLYRNEIEFAAGHGVAVHATVSKTMPHRATRLETRIIPTYEVERMDPPRPEDVPAMATAVFDMKLLGETAMGDFASQLTPLLTAYQEWIDAQAKRVANPKDDLKPYLDRARENLDECRTALTRMEAGIALLDSQPQAAQAFQFANQAMHQQRIHSIYARSVRQGGTPSFADIDKPEARSWRPFQLAFVLLNIAAFVDPTHTDREELVDLLWFPTGGGKTEAYLGVAAFAMGIRRLQREAYPLGYEGVTVLMRYTLRLLTLQQFQRATTLMAACEIMRRADPATWGDEPFRIGLWVGQSSTPNRTEDAAAVVKSALTHDYRADYSGSVGGSGTPYQLTTCPWCGQPISLNDITVDTFAAGRGRTLQYCSDQMGDCEFSKKKSPQEGIPIVVVDEEIYRRLPTLLIATVDKFAQMPWKGETQMLFGRVTGVCDRHGYLSPDMPDQCQLHRASGKLPATKRRAVPNLRPPDLIIQDELHLINGPLGTMVGLYETAVDALCHWETSEGKRVAPKILASTATIRRAKEQINAVFARDVSIFPPPALDADDNFFSKKTTSTDEAPGRLYVGICAPGTTRTGTLIAIYTAYMAAAQIMYAEYASAADPWMTTVGYFNALRELGSMRRAVEDSVKSRLERREDAGKRYINFSNVEELTSRKSAEDIPKILDRLENRFERDENGRYPEGKIPLDVVLATNMISVGVDVDRLGLMIAAGQPKATAEYIQATSRVGRKYPGVVGTVYSWTRPRDLSHYERFEHYHATFYRQVEALSVTPFAARALDRGLSGVLTALIRLLDTTFNHNHGAGDFVKTHPVVQQAQALLTERARQVTNDEDDVTYVGKSIQSRLDKWSKETQQESARLGYRMKKDGETIGILKDPIEDSHAIFTVLNSMRDVEATAGLILRDKAVQTEEEA